MGLLDKLFGQKAWFLRNLDTSQELQGQFEPEELVENLATKYAKQSVLNRQSPIIQFLSGDIDTVTFQATLFDRDALLGSAENDLLLLKEWRKRDPKLGRPPILSFWVGDSMVNVSQCTIESLGGVRYDSPTILGRLRRVQLSITLLTYTEYSLESTPSGETRYHAGRLGDYYELLTHREYGSAMLGDIIRKEHPQYPNIQTGNIIRLPSIAAIRSKQVTQTSIPFVGAYTRRETPQRTLRNEMFGLHNARIYTSHILVV